MANRIRARKWIFLSVMTLIAASIITFGVFSAKRQQAKQQIDPRPRVNYMPTLVSKVKSLEIVRAWIVDPGTAAAGVAVEIKNNSNKDVMAVDLVCGEGGITRNGLTDEEHPIVVIKPNDTTIIRMNFGEMTYGAPLVVSAVTYADGTEEGDEESLRLMHSGREHDRAVIKAQKERDAQKGAPTP
jgi:hypothetical protein